MNPQIDLSKLDPESRMQMRIITLETAVEQLNKRLSEDSALWDNQTRLLQSLAELDLRVKALEGFVKKQVLLNTETASKLYTESKPKVERSIWDLIKQYARR